MACFVVPYAELFQVRGGESASTQEHPADSPGTLWLWEPDCSLVFGVAEMTGSTEGCSC